MTVPNQHLEDQLGKQIAEINEFVAQAENELDAMNNRAREIKDGIAQAVRDRDRTERALAALTGADEPMKAQKRDGDMLSGAAKHPNYSH